MYHIYGVNQNDYLAHHGKKGQKWGERNAEWYPIADYQAYLSRKERKAAVKAAKNKEKLSKKRTKALQKARKVREKNKKIAEKEAKIAEAFDKRVSTAAEKADTDFLENNFDKMSREQIERVMSRVDLKQKVDGIRSQQTSEMLRDLTNKTQSIANTANNVMNLYNNAAKMHNALFPDKPKWGVAGDNQAVKKANVTESIVELFDKINPSAGEDPISRVVTSYDANGVKRVTTYGGKKS